MFGKNAQEYKNWIERKKYIDSMPYNLRVINTGSTGGYKAFDYQYWNLEGFNIGWQPQTLYYDFETLKKCESHIALGAKIFICIEEFKLLVDHYPNPNSKLKYYFVLKPEQIKGYDSKIEKKLKSVPCLAKKNLLRSEIAECIKKKLHYEKKKLVFKTLEEKDKYYSNYYLNLWNKEFGWEENKAELSNEQKNSIKINFKRLNSMIEYCKKQGWIPVVVIIPFSPTISNKLPDNILQECLWKPLNEVNRMGCNVLDLFHNKQLQNYKLYEDGISLNGSGKKIFNEIVQKLS